MTDVTDFAGDGVGREGRWSDRGPGDGQNPYLELRSSRQVRIWQCASCNQIAAGEHPILADNEVMRRIATV